MFGCSGFQNSNIYPSRIFETKFHFLVSEYGNLIGVKTHRDRLGSFGKDIHKIEGSGFRVLKGIEDLIEASDASWLLTFHSFVGSAHKSSKIFSFLL